MFIVYGKYRLLSAATGIVMGLAISAYSQAGSCRFGPGVVEQKISLSSRTFLVHKDASVGEVIGSYPVATIDMNQYACDVPNKIEWEFSGYPLTQDIRSDDVHDSGILGVGIRVNSQSGETKVEFVKTKPLTGSGVMPTGIITAKLEGKMIYALYINEMRFIAPSCSLKKENISVPMGQVGVASFSGVNSTVGEKNFEINLVCNTRMPIEIVLDSMGTNHSDDVLHLDQNAHSANGVGFQILHQGQPIAFKSPIKLGMSREGDYSIPFTARYIQTQDHIIAGKAVATATLNIAYP
ncbi:fimbrial protein [Xenorhabdus szentirmaii]|uniref:fimbrial protein n=1 Tax=Xenorhabdus szentirmaii TaxID=290112 RepID=UPI0019BFD4D5|nr:fimbrial protein [Xenorhabdus sp. 5]MBD2824508.1 fimbrial protein [Xenorhabdus sp. 5]